MTRSFSPNSYTDAIAYSAGFSSTPATASLQIFGELQQGMKTVFVNQRISIMQSEGELVSS